MTIENQIKQKRIENTRARRPFLILTAAIAWLGATQQIWSEMPSAFSLPVQEIESLQDDSAGGLDFRSCIQNPEGPKVSLKINESVEFSPELLMNRKYQLSGELAGTTELGNSANLTYRWTVIPPVSSQISEIPKYTPQLVLKPDQPGSYKVRLVLFKYNQLCDFKEITIEVPKPTGKADGPRLFFSKKRNRAVV